MRDMAFIGANQYPTTTVDRAITPAIQLVAE
jgi:hypothetical protein